MKENVWKLNEIARFPPISAETRYRASNISEQVSVNFQNFYQMRFSARPGEWRKYNEALWN